MQRQASLLLRLPSKKFTIARKYPNSTSSIFLPFLHEVDKHKQKQIAVDDEPIVLFFFFFFLLADDLKKCNFVSIDFFVVRTRSNVVCVLKVGISDTYNVKGLEYKFILGPHFKREMQYGPHTQMNDSMGHIQSIMVLRATYKVNWHCGPHFKGNRLRGNYLKEQKENLIFRH